MTREEAIANLNMISVAFVEPVTKEQRKLIDDTFEMAIKALDQEPCEDAISRQAVLDLLFNSYIKTELTSIGDASKEYAELCVDELNELPSVNPQPKTGHWEQYGNSWEDKFKCSECGKEQPKILCGERIIGHWSDYCPNCGCRMVDPQESEDKEV